MLQGRVVALTWLFVAASMLGTAAAAERERAKQGIADLVDQCSIGRDRERTKVKLRGYFRWVSGGLPWFTQDIANNKLLVERARKRVQSLAKILTMDINNDGSVTAYEIRQFKTRDALFRLSRLSSGSPPPSAAEMDALLKPEIAKEMEPDSNADGVISPQESRAWTDQRDELAADWQRSTTSSLLQLDRDNDKVLTMGEFMDAVIATFDQIDQNGDGVLDEKERASVRRTQKKNTAGHFTGELYCFLVDTYGDTF